MTLMELLLQKYGTNEPIMLSDISFQNYSRPWINKQLANLCAEGKLVRYEKGIYYIPTQTPFGKSLLSPWKVIEKKYITQKGETIGYYAGITIQNQLRLTTQMSNVIELYTNNETSRVRKIYVGKQRVLLRRARTKITSENANVLSFLELMNDLPPKMLNDERKEILSQFVIRQNISRQDISMYTPFFPEKTLRTLVESEVIYDVAR